jgi:hypothetical protein
MTELALYLLLRRQENVLEEFRLVRADIGDFRADIEVQSAIQRLDQCVQSLTSEVFAVAAQQDRRRQLLDRLQASFASTSAEPG